MPNYPLLGRIYLLSLYKIIFYINFYLFWYEKRIYSKWTIIYEKFKFSKFLSWDEKTLLVVTSWPLSGHLVAFFSLKLLTGHKTFSETIKSIQKIAYWWISGPKIYQKIPKIYHFFICWSKVFTIETALLFLEIFHKLWRHDRWTWNSLNTRYFGSFLKSKILFVETFLNFG